MFRLGLNALTSTTRLRFVVLTLAGAPAVFAASCTAPAGRGNANSDLGTAIASVGGMDKPTQTHVAALLLQHGIRCGMEGSILYGVWVPPQDAARALRILRDDLKHSRYDITLWKGDVGDVHTAPTTEMSHVEPAFRYDELLRSADYAPNTDAGAALRCGKVRELSNAFPYVTVSEVEERFTEPLGRQVLGHDVQLRMSATPAADVKCKIVWLRAWGAGRHVDLTGTEELWFVSEAPSP